MFERLRGEKRQEWYEKSLEERFHLRKWVVKPYYDTPDGEDLPSKAWFVTKFGSIVGIVAGLAKAYTPDPYIATSQKERFIRFCRGYLPVLMASNLYVFVTHVATNVRKKDDLANNVMGGVAAGSVLAAAFQNKTLGLIYVIGLGIGAGIVKGYYQSGGSIIPQGKPGHHSSYFLRKFDTTLYKDDIRGNWTKEP